MKIHLIYNHPVDDPYVLREPRGELFINIRMQSHEGLSWSMLDNSGDLISLMGFLLLKVLKTKVLVPERGSELCAVRGKMQRGRKPLLPAQLPLI